MSKVNVIASEHISVLHHTATPMPHTAMIESAFMPGTVKYDPICDRMMTYTGAAWTEVPMQDISIGLSEKAQRQLEWVEAQSFQLEEALRWIDKKQAEEESLEVRMKEHPGLKDAYEKFKIMDALTADHEQPE